MPKRSEHLADKTLVQLLDGELSPRAARMANAHLEACWECRTREGELAGAIGELMRSRAGCPEKSAGARALFRARLAQLAAVPETKFHWTRLPAAAAVFLAVLAVLIISSRTVSAEGPKPKSRLTPGETRPVSLVEICGAPETGQTADQDSDRRIPPETRRVVFHEYGMDPAQASAYEVDYLITPELGGATTLRNLWPQPYSARWNARVKDRLEHRLHQLVCQGKVELATAQHDISTDWISAYRKYVEPDAPR